MTRNRLLLQTAAALTLIAVVAGAQTLAVSEAAETATETDAAGSVAATVEARAPDLAVETDLISFSFTAAPAERAEPELMKLALADAMARLDELLQSAIEDKADIEPEYWRKRVLEIEDVETFNDARLISIRRNIYSDFGGAHPSFAYGATLWDRQERRALSFFDLFLYASPPPAMAAIWRDELALMKNARFGGPEGAETLADYLEESPVRLQDTPFALAPSTVPGKAGGVTFLHGPYEVGAYAEGPYEVTVPLYAIVSAIRPDYRPSFEGRPAEQAE